MTYYRLVWLIGMFWVFVCVLYGVIWFELLGFRCVLLKGYLSFTMV